MSTKHTDIVERLRKPTSVRDKDLLEAADIIIGLRVENVRKCRDQAPARCS